jgi:hypothetical protein
MPRHGEGLAPRSLTRFESWDIVFRKTLRNREFGSVEQYCTCTSCTCTVHPVMYWFYLFPVDYQVPYAGNKDKRGVCVSVSFSTGKTPKGQRVRVVFVSSETRPQ